MVIFPLAPDQTIAQMWSNGGAELETSNLVCSFVWGMGAQITFPESGRGLGHVTLQFLVYDRTYLQNYLS